MTVTCPNCGSEIPVPNRKKKSIKCHKCDMAGLEFGLEYFDEKDNPKQSFSEKHPQIIKVGCLVFTGACIAFDWWMKNRELFIDEPSSDSSHPQIPETTSSGKNIQAPETTTEDQPNDSILYTEKIIPTNACIVNLGENRHPSREKRETAAANGFDNLGPNQTWRVKNNHCVKTPVDQT